MTYTYPTVTVSGNTYNVYVSLADAEDFLAPALHATAWAAATDAQQSSAIVSATRMLDRQAWDGEKADAANALAWPRSGLEDAEGEEVADDELPQFLIDATCELAAALLEDASAQANATAGSNVKRLDARGVSVEFFGPRQGGRFPTIVQELIGRYLASVAGVAALAPRVSGTDAESAFDPCDSDDVYDVSGG